MTNKELWRELSEWKRSELILNYDVLVCLCIVVNVFIIYNVCIYILLQFFSIKF